MSFRVPVALIRHVCYPSGYRLPKLQPLEYKWEPPKPPVTVVPGFQRAAQGWVSPNTVTNYKIKGNLSNEEYRFFVGNRQTHLEVSHCRWCAECFTSILSRRAHKTPCKTLLIDLYRELRDLSRCAVCEKACKRTAWGIPLCGEKCEHEWRFASPQAFIKILVIAKKAYSEGMLT